MAFKVVQNPRPEPQEGIHIAIPSSRRDQMFTKNPAKQDISEPRHYCLIPVGSHVYRKTGSPQNVTDPGGVAQNPYAIAVAAVKMDGWMKAVNVDGFRRFWSF